MLQSLIAQIGPPEYPYCYEFGGGCIDPPLVTLIAMGVVAAIIALVVYRKISKRKHV